MRTASKLCVRIGRRITPGTAQCKRHYSRALQQWQPFILQRQPPCNLLRVRSDFFIRLFQTEGDFHNVADETLEQIQDTMEDVFEQMGDTEEEVEVSVASGVLTLSLPPHGTWVINKQTPNRQIWWSSPLSGPRRYEYEHDRWVYTRTTDEASHSGESEKDTLGATLTGEIKRLYDVDIDLHV